MTVKLRLFLNKGTDFTTILPSASYSIYGPIDAQHDLAGSGNHPLVCASLRPSSLDRFEIPALDKVLYRESMHTHYPTNGTIGTSGRIRAETYGFAIDFGVNKLD